VKVKPGFLLKTPNVNRCKGPSAGWEGGRHTQNSSKDYSRPETGTAFRSHRKTHKTIMLSDGNDVGDGGVERLSLKLKKGGKKGEEPASQPCGGKTKKIKTETVYVSSLK